MQERMLVSAMVALFPVTVGAVALAQAPAAPAEAKPAEAKPADAKADEAKPTAPASTPTAPASTPTALPPAPASAWLKAKPFAFSEGNKSAPGLVEASRVEVVEASRDEQFSLPASQAGAAQKDVLFFQRRYTPADRFALFSKAASDAQSGELMRNMPQIYDALVYCPLSNEIVFQAPPLDASGRFNTKARPTRVYVFSLETGGTELIWRRDKDREGTFVPRMSATPDCRHVLLNLALETPGNKVPYGELVYLRRPRSPVDRKGPPQVEWSFATINESSRNGVWKGFGEALFVQPRDPRRYVPSELPPAVFAVTAMVDKDRNKPLVNVFSPSGAAKIPLATGVRWARERVPAEGAVRDLFSPSVPDAADSVYMVMESSEQEGTTGANRRSLVAFQPKALSSGMKRIAEGDGVRFHSADVHPSGARLAASYTFDRSAAQVENLEKRDIGGVAELTVGGGSAVQWAPVATMLPFHALDAHHDPRPVYAADGTTLYYVHPQVGDLPEAALFAAGAKPSKELQFGSKLMRIDVPAN